MSVDEAAVLRNNAHMPRNDADFCIWILGQLHNNERYDMVEPFYMLGDHLPDMRTIYLRLENGGFANAAEFQTALVSIPTEYLASYSTHQSRAHTQATNLLLELPERFAQRNRWESNIRRRSQQHQRQQQPQQQQQQQQAPVVPLTSASTAAVQAAPPSAASLAAPAAPAAPALAQGAASDAGSVAAPDARQQCRFASPFVLRTSATPKPSGRPTTSSRQEAVGPSASNHGVSERPAHADPDDTSRQFSEAADHDSGLREARRGKKRVASDQASGSSPKRARQEVDKHKYRYVLISVREFKVLTNGSKLRIQIDGVIDREMKLAYDQKASMELEEGAQRYIDHLSHMNADDKQEETAADRYVFKEDHIEEIASRLVKYVREELNKFLAAKGQSIQPRLSLSVKRKHKDEDADDNSEEDSKPRVKREKE